MVSSRSVVIGVCILLGKYNQALSDSSLGILLYCFVECPDWAVELREKHRLFVDILKLAERLGVSKGTIYRAVDSKESLFAAVIAWSDDPDGIPATGIDGSADVASVAEGVTADLAAAVASLELTSIVASRRPLGEYRHSVTRLRVGREWSAGSRRPDLYSPNQATAVLFAPSRI